MKEYVAKVYVQLSRGPSMTFKAQDDEAALKAAAAWNPGTREHPVLVYEGEFDGGRFVGRLEGGVTMGTASPR